MATTIEELQTEIAERYGNLSQNDIDILRKLIGTDELRILGRVLGPEIASIIDVSKIKPMIQTKKRGLASR